MFKKILFCSLFVLIFLIPWNQSTNAKTWERHNTTVSADSIIAAIERGEDIEIDSCQIVGPLIKEGTWERPDTITSLIRVCASTFSDEISFKNCCFMKRLLFLEDSLCGHVRFYNTTFGGYASLSNSIFGGNVEFIFATFIEDADFSKTSFGVSTSFVYTTINRNADFRDASFGDYVNLYYIKFENMDILWKQLKDHLLLCDPPIYYMLIKNFEEKRQLDDADGVYLFLKNKERIEKPWYVRYPEYWFIQETCGYGVKPLNTLYSSMGIILLFTLFYTKSNAIKEIEKEFGPRRRRRRFRMDRKGFGKRFYDALYFSVHTFIIGIVSDWHPTDEFLIKTRKIRLFKFRTLSMIEGVLGWVLLVLFVVTLTKKFIR